MIYLFHGKDEFLSYLDAKDHFALLATQNPKLQAIIIDGDTTEIDSLVSDIFTQDMFGGDKIILIKRFLTNKSYKDKQDAILELIESYNDSPTFLIFWEDSKVASNTKFFKLFDKHKVCFGAKGLNQRTFVTWAKETNAKVGLKITPDAIQALSEFCNFVPERYHSELMKLKASGDLEIKLEDIRNNIANTYQEDIWHLIDVINGSKPGKAIKVVDQLLSQQEPAQYILAMVIRNTRLMILTSELLTQGKDSKSIASLLKIPPFTVYPLIKSVQKTDKSRLKSLYRMLYNLDFEIKIGNIEPELGLTLLATRL